MCLEHDRPVNKKKDIIIVKNYIIPVKVLISQNRSRVASNDVSAT